MKILMIGNFGTSWDNSICDEKHIADALRDLGHQVKELQREDLHFSLVNEFDFILIAQWNGYVLNVCQKLKEAYKCPVVYWAFDYQFDSNEQWHFEMAKEADLFLSKEMNNRKFYESFGCNFRWLPQQFAPMFLDKKSEIEKKYDVLFTGSYLSYAPFRTEVLKAVDKEFDLHIFSVTQDEWRKQGLKNVHPPIMDKGLPELYAKAKINLSVDWKIDADGYWSDRNAQIMCCGAKPLFKYIPLSEAIFRDKVDYFYSIEDCFIMINNRLKDGYSDKEINDTYNYAQSNLKVINSVRDLLTIIGSII